MFSSDSVCSVNFPCLAIMAVYMMSGTPDFEAAQFGAQRADVPQTLGVDIHLDS
ncbi:MAG: hypothetical protein KGZ70_04395 [Hydrogenophaga sp.]|nr:hypothetical protein [Hydrogenophaga sp.]MDO9149652.1 hypothetical protein [Hydrogenophaga sp.]